MDQTTEIVFNWLDCAFWIRTGFGLDSDWTRTWINTRLPTKMHAM